MAMHQFKAESKKLLDLMINSIYTNIYNNCSFFNHILFYIFRYTDSSH